MRIGVVGYGVVGRALAQLFQCGQRNEIAIFDKYLSGFNTEASQRSVNSCDLVFLSVPTPTSADGFSADISAVRECLDWINAPVCIRSTVPPGTTRSLLAQTGKRVCFSPEYIGESPFHPWKAEADCGFVIVGGTNEMGERVFTAYRSVVKEKMKFVLTDPTTAEVCKYMENSFLATKVAFVNQFYDIAKSFEVDFRQLRSLWLLDSRIGASHTEVTTERGFGGRCLPKDLRAIIAAMAARGGAPLLEGVLSYNERLRRPGMPIELANSVGVIE